ncbi:MAG: ATPase, T2SS/T4P/T4SS family [Syntrophales bacterium]|nr:ATPase, T2SS/T4P/T4SS family [Syntrophales bacterium]
MKTDPRETHIEEDKWPVEEITTTVGKKYKVFVIDEGRYSSGFFGMSTWSNSRYRMIFFTTQGIKRRCQIRPVGEILQEQGTITNDRIEKVLEEQEKLKNQRVGEIIAFHNDLAPETIEETIEKARKEGKAPRIRVGDILIEAGLVTKEQVEMALSRQDAGKKKKVGELLIEKGFISEDQLLNALATKFRMRIVDLANHVPSKIAMDAVPHDVAVRLTVFPVMDKGDRLVIATSQPTDPTVYDNLRFYTSRKIELVVATSHQILEAINKFYPKVELLLDNLIGDLSVDQEEDLSEKEDSQAFSESDSQVVNLVNKILLDASVKGVSDIHFEPGMIDQPFVVRYRVDGLCHLAHQIPGNFKKAIMSRLKIMSNLDIAERRKPQSGKIIIKYQDRRIEFRVEITPTSGSNEDAVLRILSTSVPLQLDNMGFSASNLKVFRELLSQPYGMILCVGPTGSGKTTTLHSALGHINTVERKIWTVEDPVEITQQGLRQVQVQPKIGLTFAEVLRSFLRADPDVIMIGEMRDTETAKTAIEASLTGHLVLSTLHTNSAPETIVRLIEMGMDTFNFADALLGILAQRLARKLCDFCKETRQLKVNEFERLVHMYDPYWYHEHEMPAYSENMTISVKAGCEKCGGTGYKGRVALHELAVATESLKNAIKEKANADELKKVAIKDGMRTLLMDGVQKVFQGITDSEQVLRVCSSHTISEVP